MTNRPSLRELLGVWLVGAAGEIVAYDVIMDPETVLTAPVVAAGLAFILIPSFLVVYSLIWAWPLAARGDRATISSLVLFGVVVGAASGWSWIGIQAITLTTVLLRVLALFTPLAFGACAVAAACVYGRRVSLESRAVAEAVQSQLVRDRLIATLLRRAHSSV